MGLFDKKYCDICGGQIGLLGNRKLKDGNCCKDCVSKLSPWFSDRKESTVAEIKAQISYRERNKNDLNSFMVSQKIGKRYCVYVDGTQRKFFVTSATNWKNANPDIVDISAVKGLTIKVNESKSEEYTKDSEGNRVSYDPKKYKYSYEYRVEISVNHPYFDEIRFELTADDPASPFSAEFKEYADMANSLSLALTGKPFVDTNSYQYTAESDFNAPETEAPAEVEEEKKEELAEGEWICPTVGCGVKNNGNFCLNCGTKKPVLGIVAKFCPECGYKFQEGATVKFCPGCGKQVG